VSTHTGYARRYGKGNLGPTYREYSRGTVSTHGSTVSTHGEYSRRYGKGNLGPTGIKAFLLRHKCNVICAYLGLANTNQNDQRLPVSTQSTP
jgi:hypothetical protein